MTRNDFVSNSSTCSFVISSEDNKKHKFLKEYSTFTLKEYLERFLYDELMMSLIRKEFETVDDNVYPQIFSHNANVFPESVKEDIIKYCDIFITLKKSITYSLVTKKLFIKSLFIN